MDRLVPGLLLAGAIWYFVAVIWPLIKEKRDEADKKR